MSQIFILGINKRLNKVFNMKQKFLILAVEKLYNSRLYILKGLQNHLLMN